MNDHFFSNSSDYYTVTDFSGVLRFLAVSAHGQWWFEPNPSSGLTHIKWSYTFSARSLVAAPVLLFVTKVLWRGYMHKALMMIKSRLEDQFAQPLLCKG